MGKINKIKVGENPDGSPKIFRIDGLIRPELDKVRTRVKKKNWDYVALVSTYLILANPQ